MNQDQRELLELAAYAIGGIYCGDGTLRTEVNGWSNWTEWNPLTNKADAFDLMVKLRLPIEYRTYDVDCGQTHSAEIEDVVVGSHKTIWAREEIIKSEEAATMLAITRAAAEIGKQMKGNGE